MNLARLPPDAEAKRAQREAAERLADLINDGRGAESAAEAAAKRLETLDEVFAREQSIKAEAASAAEAGKLAPYGCDDVGVVSQQVQPRFMGAAATAGRHHHDVGPAHLFDSGSTYLAVGVKGCTMAQVHGLAFGDGAVQVVQPQLVGRTGMQGRNGHAGAHPAGADDADGLTHVSLLLVLAAGLAAHGRSLRGQACRCLDGEPQRARVARMDRRARPSRVVHCNPHRHPP